METNNGKPLSPWKVPSRISLKRIRHKINSDLLTTQNISTMIDKNLMKQQQHGKRNRLMINKFALARSISTPTSNDNIQSINNTSSNIEEKNNDEHLLARLHQIMPPIISSSSLFSSSSLIISNEMHFNSSTKTLSFDNIFDSNHSNLSKTTDEFIASFPIDWSLKSSCRFQGLDSGSLLANFMKLRSTDESLALNYICSSSCVDNEKAYFRSLTSYWTYPHLPWLRLFPRSQQQQQTSTNINSNALDEQIQTVLQDEWKLSFQSLFQAFRTRNCPYFYMCTHTFNILFREDISSQLIVIINPTTSGLRSIFEREGIEFIMADGGDLLNNSTNKTIDENDHEDNENENENDDDDDDNNNIDENDINCTQWLEDMGLTATATTSTNTNHERHSFLNKKKQIHQKGRSTTILIQDITSVNSLFNFLLNKSQRLCIPLTGCLTGVPPTLISPRPFLNATLRYLNVHFQSNSILTIEGGPLLPDRLKNLWNLFQDKLIQTQMTCFHVERTSAFNFNHELSQTIKLIQLNDDGQLRAQFFHN